jgi:hypothetical protein
LLSLTYFHHLYLKRKKVRAKIAIASVFKPERFPLKKGCSFGALSDFPEFGPLAVLLPESLFYPLA